MELRVLNYFLAVAREENFTRAAEILHVTQPTLSRQIADLEDELGVKLFVRSNHNIILTEDGLILRRRAQEILSLADKTKRDFKQKEDNLEGIITIGSGEFLCTRCLADCIAVFHKKYPRVQYELYSGNAINVSENIERGLLDMGVMLEPIDIRKYEFISMPICEEWGVYVTEDSPLAGKNYVEPNDLAGIPLISPTNNIAEGVIGKWLGDFADHIKVIAKGNLLYNTAMLAQSGIGAVISIHLNCTYDGLKFLPFRPALTNATVLAWKKEQFLSTAATLFIGFAKEYIKGITDDYK